MLSIITRIYLNKGYGLLKPGCTLQSLAKLCLPSSMTAEFYPLPEGDKELLEKMRENMMGGPSIVFIGKTVVSETQIRSPPNVCKSIEGIDASELSLRHVSADAYWTVNKTGI